jgi:hypothetical protein
MRDVLTSEEANSLPDGSVVRGTSDSGDRNAVAVKRYGGWVFIDREAGDGASTLEPAGVFLPILYGNAYELLYLPPEPPLTAKVGDTLSADEANRLPVGAVIVTDKGRHDHNVLIRLQDGFAWATALTHMEMDYYPNLVIGGWTLVHLPTEG